MYDTVIIAKIEIKYIFLDKSRYYSSRVNVVQQYKRSN